MNPFVFVLVRTQERQLGLSNGLGPADRREFLLQSEDAFQLTHEIALGKVRSCESHSLSFERPVTIKRL